MFIMFYYKIQWFYQDFKSENLYFSNLYSVHVARIPGLLPENMLSPPKWGTKHLYNSKDFSFVPEEVWYFYFLEAKFINVFKMCQLTVSFKIRRVKFTLVI